MHEHPYAVYSSLDRPSTSHVQIQTPPSSPSCASCGPKTRSYENKRSNKNKSTKWRTKPSIPPGSRPWRMLPAQAVETLHRSKKTKRDPPCNKMAKRKSKGWPHSTAAAKPAYAVTPGTAATHAWGRDSSSSSGSPPLTSRGRPATPSSACPRSRRRSATPTRPRSVSAASTNSVGDMRASAAAAATTAVSSCATASTCGDGGRSAAEPPAQYRSPNASRAAQPPWTVAWRDTAGDAVAASSDAPREKRVMAATSEARRERYKADARSKVLTASQWARLTRGLSLGPTGRLVLGGGGERPRAQPAGTRGRSAHAGRPTTSLREQ